MITSTKFLTYAAALIASLAIATEGSTQSSDVAAFENRVLQKIERLQQNMSLDKLGPLTGIWRVEVNDDSGDNPFRHHMHLGDVVVKSAITESDGSLFQTGIAERSGDGWRGRFQLACKDCCRGTSWTDWGTYKIDPGSGMLMFRSDTFKLDPDTCELTDDPDIVAFNMRLMDFATFQELAPGKLIHIVGAPAVGNQSAQYKAAVELGWDFSGTGVAAIDLVARNSDGGSQLLNKSRDISGSIQHVTTVPGEQEFLIVAYNSAGQVLHFEFDDITIPRIPGITD